MRPEIAVLVETYVAIASTLPQTSVEMDADAVIAIGPFAHPICNFGVAFSPQGVDRVLRAATGRPHFNVYSFESQGRQDFASLTPALSMRIMTAPARFLDGPPLAAADTPSSKSEVARFMAEQFFTNHRPEVRNRITEATSRASGASLYSFRDADGSIVGAAMLTDHTSMLGLYNVCVAQGKRERGWGSTIVRTVLSEAARRKQAITLQCDLSLEAWYERLGFHTVDTLVVYNPSSA